MKLRFQVIDFSFFLQFYTAARAHEVLWWVCGELNTPTWSAYFAGFQVWHLNHVLIRLKIRGNFVTPTFPKYFECEEAKIVFSATSSSRSVSSTEKFGRSNSPDLFAKALPDQDKKILYRFFNPILFLF